MKKMNTLIGIFALLTTATSFADVYSKSICKDSTRITIEMNSTGLILSSEGNGALGSQTLYPDPEMPADQATYEMHLATTEELTAVGALEGAVATIHVEGMSIVYQLTKSANGQIVLQNNVGFSFGGTECATQNQK